MLVDMFRNKELQFRNKELQFRNKELQFRNKELQYNFCKLLFLLVGPTHKIHRSSSNFTEFFKNVFLKLNAVKRTI